jgi:hypothetical protein
MKIAGLGWRAAAVFAAGCTLAVGGIWWSYWRSSIEAIPQPPTFVAWKNINLVTMSGCLKDFKANQNMVTSDVGDKSKIAHSNGIYCDFKEASDLSKGYKYAAQIVEFMTDINPNPNSKANMPVNYLKVMAWKEMNVGNIRDDTKSDKATIEDTIFTQFSSLNGSFADFEMLITSNISPYHYSRTLEVLDKSGKTITSDGQAASPLDQKMRDNAMEIGRTAMTLIQAKNPNFAYPSPDAPKL